MTYSGNPSLSHDVQQRVLDTFGQTLDLAGEGSRQEALLGCDFVLRMDPQFEPARRLQERLRASAGAVVDTDDLRRALDPNASNPPGSPSQVVPADLFADLDGLGLELPDLPPAADLHQEMQDLLERRRFADLMALAERERAAVTADPLLSGIVQEAQSRMEAEPYVRKFLDSARAALQAGSSDEAGRLLDKVRALDGSHPELAEMDALRRRTAVAPVAPLVPDSPDNPGDPMTGFDLSFDSPGLDLGTPLHDAAGFSSGGVATEGDERVRALLDEGQRAFDGGDLQGAIDAWSRIFLIDIDHAEASRRIEQARKLKAESERQVEEIFHDGVARIESGDAAGARQAFERVLEMQPGYFQARDYLQQLEAGKMPVPVAAAPAPRTPPRDAFASAPESLLHAGGGLDAPDDDLKEEILVPPEPGGGAAKSADRRPAKTGRARERRPAGKMFVLVGSIVLLAVLAGSWFVYQNRERFFPNSQTEEPAATAPAPDPIARAIAQHKAGKTPTALSQLKRLPPTDPHYQQAQALIKEWEGGAPSSAAPPAPPPGPSPSAAPAVVPAVSSERQALLGQARKAYAEGSYLRTVDILEQAANTGKLEPAEEDMLTNAKQQVEPITKQVDLFRQHEWEFVIPELWKLREKIPGNHDVDRLLIDSYYNLGVRDLQRADAAKAAERFQEALKLTPNDALLRRNLLFAQTYQERQKDLLYKIYIKYLTYR